MQIKSLLLGSAAVLVSISTARAADAIVVEPEPVEYVRICDAYGAGWFFIPGTETCLKFDGDVRVQYDVSHYHEDVSDETSLHEADYRARLNVRARNETEYGTLSSRIRFVAASEQGGHDDVLSSSEGPGSANTEVDTAVISLGGFMVGYDNSYWHRTGDWGYYEARYDGLYVEQFGLFAEYTYEANGWAFTGGVEDGLNTGEAGQPDVYGGVSYANGGWFLAGIVYRDTSEADYAWKVRGDYDFGTSGFKLGAFYFADDGNTDYVKGHTWGVTAKINLMDNMILFAGYSDYADQYTDGAASATNATIGVAWDVVPGLRVQPEYSITTYDHEGKDQLNGGTFSLRIERSF